MSEIGDCFMLLMQQQQQFVATAQERLQQKIDMRRMELNVSLMRLRKWV